MITIVLRIESLLQKTRSLRQGGALLRKLIIDNWKTEDVVTIDFRNETIASASILDEVAKLFNEFPKEEVKRRLQFVNMDPSDERLLVHLAKLRLERKKQMVTD